VPGFTGGGRGSQTTPELALIDQVIAAINERLGGNLTDADKVWVQQSFEYAAEDPQIQQAAQANTEDNFAYVFMPRSTPPSWVRVRRWSRALPYR
jgi:type I restriction enzyme R subunit